MDKFPHIYTFFLPSKYIGPAAPVDLYKFLLQTLFIVIFLPWTGIVTFDLRLGRLALLMEGRVFVYDLGTLGCLT